MKMNEIRIVIYAFMWMMFVVLEIKEQLNKLYNKSKNLQYQKSWGIIWINWMKNEDLFLSQENNLKELEKRFSEDIKHMKKYDTPAGANHAIIWPEIIENLLDQKGQEKYHSEVGLLLWLMKYSRPDILMLFVKQGKWWIEQHKCI
jgi:hypothetical protein